MGCIQVAGPKRCEISGKAIQMQEECGVDEGVGVGFQKIGDVG